MKRRWSGPTEAAWYCAGMTSASKVLVLLAGLSAWSPAQTGDRDRQPRDSVPSPTSVEALLNATAAEVGETLSAEGKGYSYYTYGTRDLLYAVGDLDGDGRPEIAARAVYFMGVGSYDLVDIFADHGDGYARIDFLNLYHLGLQDGVEFLEIRDGVLWIGTTGFERGRKTRKCGAFLWNGPKDVVRSP